MIVAFAAGIVAGIPVARIDLTGGAARGLAVDRRIGAGIERVGWAAGGDTARIRVGPLCESFFTIVVAESHRDIAGPVLDWAGVEVEAEGFLAHPLAHFGAADLGAMRLVVDVGNGGGAGHGGAKGIERHAAIGPGGRIAADDRAVGQLDGVHRQVEAILQRHIQDMERRIVLTVLEVAVPGEVGVEHVEGAVAADHIAAHVTLHVDDLVQVHVAVGGGDREALHWSARCRLRSVGDLRGGHAVERRGGVGRVTGRDGVGVAQADAEHAGLGQEGVIALDADIALVGIALRRDVLCADIRDVDGGVDLGSISQVI